MRLAMGHGKTSRFPEFRVGVERHAVWASCLVFGASDAAFPPQSGMVPSRSKDLSLPVNRLEVFRRWLRAWLRKHRVELALTLRMTVAAVAALGSRRPRFAAAAVTVLTALIVTQLSIGRSLKTSVDYLMGTVGGTIYGAALALLIPHDTEMALLLVLVLAVAPVALVAALKRNLNAVPVSSIIVVLMPALTHAGPLDSAIYRVLEVGLGVVVGSGRGLLVLPAGGHRLARQEAARTLDLLAQALGRVLAGSAHCRRYRGPAAEPMTASASRWPSSPPVPSKASASARRGSRSSRTRSRFSRTLQRLRHDVITVGRIARGDPLPEPVQGRLAPKLAAIGRAGSDYLRASGMALAARRPPPSEAELEKAFVAALAEITALRREGLTRD